MKKNLLKIQSSSIMLLVISLVTLFVDFEVFKILLPTSILFALSDIFIFDKYKNQ